MAALFLRQCAGCGSVVAWAEEEEEIDVARGEKKEEKGQGASRRWLRLEEASTSKQEVACARVDAGLGVLSFWQRKKTPLPLWDGLAFGCSWARWARR